MTAWRSGWGVAIVAAVGLAVPALALGQATAPVAPVVPVAPALPPGVIAPGVAIAGVPVAGLTRAQATAAVIAQHVVPRRTPLLVTFRGRRIVVPPVKAGYVADVAYAVRVALIYGRTKAVPPEGVVVPLKERVNRKRLRAILNLRADKYDIEPRDAVLTFRGATPVVRKPRVGIVIDVAKSAKRVEQAIFTRDRASYPLVRKRVRPAVTSVGPAVIVERDKFRVTWWKAGKRITFPIAVGTSSHPTPSGNFRIVSKQVNPTWFPPSSPWAAGLGPVPPGTDNPLGTRWMGTSAPAIGLHGTPVSSSVGTRASHGCIRMYIHDAERLFDLVEVGTPVIIR